MKFQFELDFFLSFCGEIDVILFANEVILSSVQDYAFTQDSGLKITFFSRRLFSINHLSRGKKGKLG